MTPTLRRIQLIAMACQHPVFVRLMGNVNPGDLIAWLEAELGHIDALDDFIPHGSIQSQAFAPGMILHIVSGNTPHAAIQSLLRGLLLDSHNIIKLPSRGLPGFQEWIAQFPQALGEKVEIHTVLTDETWGTCGAVIAIGSDDTIASVQRRILAHQIFIPHGHKISIGIVYSDLETAASLAARDVSLFNQRGCLSPHAIYVPENKAQHFAGLLAGEMKKFTQTHLPGLLTLSEAGAVRNAREMSRFVSANTNGPQLWESQASFDWTVIYENNPRLRLSCLNRCIYVRPLPPAPDLKNLGKEARHLSTISIHPFEVNAAKNLTNLPAHRICPLGQSQQPSLFWHHDGFAPLASLVKWKDIG